MMTVLILFYANKTNHFEPNFDSNEGHSNQKDKIQEENIKNV